MTLLTCAKRRNRPAFKQVEGVTTLRRDGRLETDQVRREGRHKVDLMSRTGANFS